MNIERPIYLEQLALRRHNGMIKIITGLRRCGKSYLLFNLFHQMLLEDGVTQSHILQIDLEDFTNVHLRDPKKILEHILSFKTEEGWYYVMIDEVQHLNEFEEVLNTLLKRGNLDVYVTGSNARFLSKDVVTTFRGRGDEVRVHPLSFAEYHSVDTGRPFNEVLSRYMLYGGMPQIADYQNNAQIEVYLKSLFEESYIRDIRERYNIQDDGDLSELIDMMASSIGSFQNPLKLQNTYKSVKQSRISQETIKRYLDYLQDAYLIEKALRYDIRGRNYISTPQKYYFEDLGLRNARLNFRQDEPTHLMENLVYNELRMRGYSVDVGQVVQNIKDANGTSKRQPLEVDFVCNMGYKRYYIQSVYSMPSYDKIEQELRSLTLINDSFLKVIITADPLASTHQMENGVLVLTLQDFLLNPDSLPGS